MLVYALFDPDTHDLCYIGKTRDTLARRLTKHCAPSAHTKNTAVAQWLGDLRRRGVRPDCCVLIENSNPSVINAAEEACIAHALSVGAKLVNTLRGGSDENKRTIYCDDGRIFPGWPEACKALQITKSTLHRKLRGEFIRKQRYHVAYVPF